MEGGAANYLGGAPVLSFGKTDREIERQYQQQQQQQLYSQKLYQQNSVFLQKQMEGMRSADTPGAYNLYNQWKNSEMALMYDPRAKNPRTQKDIDYVRGLRDASSRAEAALIQHIGQSKEIAKNMSDLNDDIMKNWVNYDDNAQAAITHANNLTSDEIIAHGLNTKTPYAYPGGNYDFGKV